MRRGQVYFVDLEPVRGSEASKWRPAVVVSNDGLNRTAARLGRGVITVVPIASNIRRVYPFQVALDPQASGLSVHSKAQAEQVRTVDVTRLGDCVGALPAAVLAQVDQALRLHLAL